MIKAPKMKKLLLLLICTTIFVALSAGSALANVAANTAIVNTASLTFTGGSAQASVTVTVALVPSSPNVTITNAAGAYTTPDSPTLTNSVVVTATANGPASYSITPAVNASSNTAAPSVSSGGSVTVGASVTTGASGTTYLTVPAGGASGNNAAVNGIAVNDTIVFLGGATVYTRQVTGTVDNGDGTFQLVWSSSIPAGDIPGNGVQVGERQTINITVAPGTVVVPGTDITVTAEALVATAGAGDVTVVNGTANVWSTPSPNVTITKYVRNLVPAGNSGATGNTSLTVNTATNVYYTGGVTGKPGDTLEYVIVATNTGATDLANCAISDLVPEAYVAFSAASYAGSAVFYIAPDGSTGTFAAAAPGANQASFVPGSDPNLVVNVGAGANASLTGTIPAGQNVTVAYQVVINP